MVTGSDDVALIFCPCAAGLLTFAGNRVRGSEHLLSASTRMGAGLRNAGLKYFAHGLCGIESSQIAAKIALNGLGDWNNVLVDQRAGAIVKSCSPCHYTT